MAEQTAPVTSTPETGAAAADIKAGETLLKVDAPAADQKTNPNPDPAAEKAAAEKAAAEKAAADKAEADKGLTAEEIKARDEKAAADKAAAEKAKGEKGEKVVPEKYEFKAPEGMELDQELVGELTNHAKEMKLSQEEADKFLGMGHKLVQKTANGIKAAQEKSWADARTQWVKDIKADKDIGGAKFAESREMALRAVRFAGIPELKQVFDSGWGDHPALFKAFVKFGKTLGDDRVVDSDASASAEKTVADILYPSQGKQS